MTTALKMRHASNLSVGFTSLGPATERGLPLAQIESIADYLAAHQPEPPQDTLALDFMEILAIDPELSGYLSNVVLFRDEDNPDEPKSGQNVKAQRLIGVPLGSSNDSSRLLKGLR